MKIGKKVLIFSLCGVLTAGAIGTASVLLGGREGESAVISGGMAQLAGQTYLAASAVKGQSITFTGEWFDERVGGGKVSAITVTELPPPTEGVLRLGYSAVERGQSIPRETLSYLSFIPNDGVQNSSFSFVPATEEGTCGYALSCALLLTDSVNCCPTGTKSVTAVSTHETLSFTGTLTAQDPEGDALYFEIASYPGNGTVELDATTGHFVYRPKDGFHGEDSFTWRVQDAYGSFAPEATVSVTVHELATGYLFADMMGHVNHSDALRVSEKGLLGGEEMGGKHYFHPERTLTRAAFVTILLEAAEIKTEDATDTGFADDAEIPAGMKGAIRYARDQGWLGSEERFRPNEPITRAEAARIAAAALGLSAPGYHETVSDFSSIPVDAADALYAIYEGGYIDTVTGGALAPAGELSRGDAAKFFARVLDGRD